MKDLLWVYMHVYYQPHGPGERSYEEILDFSLKHWARLPRTRVFVYYDRDTTPYTLEVIKHHKNATGLVGPFVGPKDEERANWAARLIQEGAGRTEWATWVDDDELWWNPDVEKHLLEMPGAVRIIKPMLGYDMASDEFPSGYGQIYDEVQIGRPNPMDRKPVILRPGTPLRWAAGKHRLLAGPAPFEDPDIIWMHFRYLGNAYMEERNRKNFSRWDLLNTLKLHGAEVNPSRLEESFAWREAILREGTNVVRPPEPQMEKNK